MDITYAQIILCIIFILCIVLITLYYKNNNNKELFYVITEPNPKPSRNPDYPDEDSIPDDPIINPNLLSIPNPYISNNSNNSNTETQSQASQTQATRPQGSQSQASQSQGSQSKSQFQSKYNIKNSFNDNDISNEYVKQALNNILSNIDNIFDNYAELDSAININNNGKVCDNWGTYNNNEFSPLSNSCKVISNSKTNSPQCLSNNIVVSCSNYYADDVINSYTNIDVQTYKQTIVSDILLNADKLISDLNNKSILLDNKLDNLNTQLNIANQQSYFINNNSFNIDDKKKNINKTSEQYEKDENDILIKQINFKNFLEQNSNNDKSSNTYYKIIIGLIITLIVIGVINLLSTETL